MFIIIKDQEPTVTLDIEVKTAPCLECKHYNDSVCGKAEKSLSHAVVAACKAQQLFEARS